VELLVKISDVDQLYPLQKIRVSKASKVDNSLLMTPLMPSSKEVDVGVSPLFVAYFLLHFRKKKFSSLKLHVVSTGRVS